MEDRIRENTDLIDVSDIAPEFEAQGAVEEEPIEKTPLPEMPVEEKSTGGFVLASLRDRLAAAIIDGLILFAVYWFMLIAYRSIALGEVAGPIPAKGWHGIIFNGLFLLIAFLYFFIFEAVFYASIGKLICRLSIRNALGEKATIGGIFWRNILRIIDVILFFIAVGIVILEKTSWNQRLGDLVGRTVVIRKLSKTKRQHAITLDMLASASGRLGAFLIDCLIFVPFCIGYFLLLNPEEPLVSMLLVVLSPIILMLYFFLLEAFTGTTVGKLIFGYTVAHEDGSNIDLSSALMRTVTRPFDNNPFGFICLLLSIRKQRPGDLAAETLVLKVPRQVKGLVGAFIAVMVVGAIIFAGLENRNNFLSGSFKVNFLPAVDITTRTSMGLQQGRQQILLIREFAFAAGSPKQIRKPSIFQPGEKVFLNFKVSGYEMKGSKAWIQEDLLVRYPDESIGLKLENVIDFYERIDDTEPIALTNNIALPDNALPGRYTVTLTIRDKHSGKQLKEQRFFYVTPSNRTNKVPQGVPRGGQSPQEMPKEDQKGPRTIVPRGGIQKNSNNAYAHYR